MLNKQYRLNESMCIFFIMNSTVIYVVNQIYPGNI